MEFAIQKDETLDGAIRRIVAERIALAEGQLGDASKTDAERVHGARKRFKEIRAVLRLVRFVLGEQFNFENLWYRDAGRELSAARDVEAVMAIAGTLRDKADPVSRRVIARVRRVLGHRRRRLSKDLGDKIARMLGLLRAADKRVASWPHLEDRFSTISDGLERTYREGRRALHTSIDLPTATHVHEWRKRVKDHWYHVQLLREIWAPVLKCYRDVMEELSDTLGEHHDFTVFRQWLVDDPQRFGEPDDVHWLLTAIDARRSKLEDRAFHIGRRVYAESPGRWRDRFKSYWEEWHA